MSTDEQASVESVEVVLAPEDLHLVHRFRDVHHIELLGSVTEREQVAHFREWAKEHEWTIGNIETIWTLRIEATGYRQPGSVRVTPDEVPPEELFRIREEEDARFQAAVDGAQGHKSIVIMAREGWRPQFQVKEGEPVQQVEWVEAAHRDRHQILETECMYPDPAEPLDSGCYARYVAYRRWFGTPNGFLFGPWKD